MLSRGRSQLKTRSFSYLSRSIVSFVPKSDPLRILFCGADQFSIASLKALHAEHVANSDFIKSIDVLCKSDKKSGRGLKAYRSGLCVGFGLMSLQLTINHQFPLLVLQKSFHFRYNKSRRSRILRHVHTFPYLYHPNSDWLF